MSFEILALLFLIAVVASWVDTLAGGGGLIVVPTLMFVGLPPVQALATNKCQGFVGTLTATATLLLKGKLHLRRLIPIMVYTAIGSILGTCLIQNIETGWLNWAIPLLLLMVAGYFIASPSLGEKPKTPRISKNLWDRMVAPLIGFYDGFFGPGTGSFFAASGVVLRGQTLIEATVIAKPLNFISNLSALAIFVIGEQVLWSLGLIMMAGQILGSFLGTHSIYWGGAKLIRPLVITVCIAMSIKQLFDLL